MLVRGRLFLQERRGGAAAAASAGQGCGVKAAEVEVALGGPGSGSVMLAAGSTVSPVPLNVSQPPGSGEP